MIATAQSIPSPSPRVVSGGREVVRLTDAIRVEATAEVARLWGDVSGKRINAVGLVGFGRQGISRALNGCESNPVFRLAGWFVLARRLGIPKHRLQRILDWLQGQLDAAYDDEPRPSVGEVLDREQDLDSAEDPPQMRARGGDRMALREWLDRKLECAAYDRAVVIPAVTAELQADGR